jgi:hypothetical protein
MIHRSAASVALPCGALRFGKKPRWPYLVDATSRSLSPRLSLSLRPPWKPATEFSTSTTPEGLPPSQTMHREAAAPRARVRRGGRFRAHSGRGGPRAPPSSTHRRRPWTPSREPRREHTAAGEPAAEPASGGEAAAVKHALENTINAEHTSRMRP